MLDRKDPRSSCIVRGPKILSHKMQDMGIGPLRSPQGCVTIGRCDLEAKCVI